MNRIFAAALLIFCLYRLIPLFQSPPPENLVYGDMVAYASTYLQSTGAADYSADTLFGNGQRRELFNRYSAIYMAGFGLFYRLGGGDIQITLGLYSLACQVIYLLFMFPLLRAWLKQDWLALAISFASLAPAGFAGTGTVWGFDPALALPFHLQTALSVGLIYAAYGWWGGTSSPSPHSAPSGYGSARSAEYREPHPRPLPEYREGGLGAVLLGLAFAIPAARLNVITGLALVQWLGPILLYLAWRGRLPWRDFFLWGGSFGLSFFFLYVILAPAGNTADGAYSWPTAQAIITIGQGAMVFPWGGERWAWLTDSPAQGVYLWFFGLHLVLSGLAGLRWWRTRGRGALLALICVQTLYAYFLLNAGALPLVAGGYLLWRAWRGEVSEAEGGALAALILALLLGFGQQTALYYLWREGQAVGLTALLFELARFAHFAYLPLYFLLGRAAYVTLEGRPIALGLGMAAAWAGLIYFNLGLVPFPVAASPGSNGRPPLTEDYQAAAAWAQHNTPPDSLFHLSSLEGSFRYYGRRSVLSVREEWIYGMYTGLDPQTLKNLEARLVLGRGDSQTLIDTLNAAGADYLLAGPEQSPPYGAEAAVVFQNASYTIYAVAEIPALQSPIAQYPGLWAAYQAYTPPWPEGARLFNPATGNVAVRQGVLAEFSGAVADLWGEGDLLALRALSEMRFEAELDLSGAPALALSAWRADKQSYHLAEAGIEYLIYDSQWGGFLSDPELAALNDPAQYRLVAEWAAEERAYKLYQITSPRFPARP
jgi:hypothetical protein